MKYGRPVNCGDADGSVRMMDVVSVPDELPAWAQDAEAWLSTMFANQKEAWVSNGVWFVSIPDAVQPCAAHTGSDFTDPLNYLNPDGTRGDGLTDEQRALTQLGAES